jgi:hypothetical protein
MENIPEMPRKSPKPSFNIWLVIGALVIIALVAVLFLFKPSGQPVPEEETESALEVVATKGTLPDITTTDNPAEELPETNPATKANPFSETYKNPFE